MTQRWSVCCYLPSLLPDQLFKPGVVVRAEVPSQFAAGRENRTIKKKPKIPKPCLFLPRSLRHCFLSGPRMIGAHTCRSSITSKFDWEAHFYLILIYFRLSLMAPSLWPRAYVVLDRWRLIGETEVLQALCSIHSPSLRLSFLISKAHLIGIMQIYVCLAIMTGEEDWGEVSERTRQRRARREKERKGGRGVGACSPTYRHIQIISRMISWWIRPSKHSRNMHIYVLRSHTLVARLSFRCTS